MPRAYYDPATYRARDSIGYMVRRLYALLAGRVESRLARDDLTLTQWIVLMYLRDGIARTASDIVREFQHDSGALTRVIDQLERRGLLARRRSSRDRRVVELELTPAGRKLIRGLLPGVVAELNRALAPLNDAETAQFHDMLQRLLEHQQTPEPEPLVGGRPRAGVVARVRARAR